MVWQGGWLSLRMMVHKANLYHFRFPSSSTECGHWSYEITLLPLLLESISVLLCENYNSISMFVVCKGFCGFFDGSWYGNWETRSMLLWMHCSEHQKETLLRKNCFISALLLIGLYRETVVSYFMAPICDLFSVFISYLVYLYFFLSV
jgi:hypothetical protein